MSHLVVGIGSRLHGDDAAGLVALDRLAGLTDESAQLVGCSGDVSLLVGLWGRADRAVVIDAVVSGAEPGTLHIVDGREGVPAAWGGASTHLLGLAEALELSRVLGVMPAELTIIGVEAGAFPLGEDLSPAVDVAIDRVVARVAEMTRA